MNIECGWCGEWRGVQLTRVHLQSAASRCGSSSPFDPRATCRRERGHPPELLCTADAPDSELYLCFRCFGIYRETGERPPAYRMRAPGPGPITGTPLDLSRLRRGP